MADPIAEAFVTLRPDTSQFGRETEAAIGSSLQSITASLMQSGALLTSAVTLPILGMGTVAVRSFASFDSAMTQSLAIMGDVSEALRGEMAEAAREVGRTTLVSATQAAEAYFFLASAGLDATQSVAAMPQVAAFAQAGMFSMARATDLAMDAQSALGLTVDDSAQNLDNLIRVTDVLVKANILANATVEQFSESLTNRAAAALRAVNKDVEEGVAVLAAFADQGIKGQIAGERLNITLRDLQFAATKNAEAFDRAGVSVFDAEGTMRNIADIIGEVENALSGLSAEQRLATLTQLGFTQESLAGIQALLGTSESIREYERALRDAGGTTEDVASRQLE